MMETSEWLASTALSQGIQNIAWIIPTVQSIHILAIAVLFGSAVVLDLKLAGIVARTDSSAVIFRRYMPWLWWALGVLVVSGLIMVVGEPDRTLTNWVFWTKMGLLLVAFSITLIMRVPMLRADMADNQAVWTAFVKPLGILAVAIWILIIFCGRWIAYSY
jgi:uncharacterized membrane protein